MSKKTLRSSWRVNSHAKVNLHLHVQAIRPDGFHPIATRFQSIALCDELRFTRADGNRLTITGARLPTDGSNLVLQALERFNQTTGLESSWHIHLEKRIPIAAGLGGGSSNAAATLAFLNRIHEKPLSDENLARLALELGSDVPYFLIGGTADARGRGEELQLRADEEKQQLVLVKPPFGVRAGFAYEEFDRLLQEGRLLRNESTWRNDLEPGVFEAYPDLAEIREQMLSHGAQAAFMCGSGSTMCALCNSTSQAEGLARLEAFSNYQVFLSHFITAREFRQSLTPAPLEN